MNRSGRLLRTLLTALLTGYGVSTGDGTDLIISRTVSRSVCFRVEPVSQQIVRQHQGAAVVDLAGGILRRRYL